MGSMRVLNGRGDSETRWDPKDPAQVASAGKEFLEYKAKGALFFVPSLDGGEQIRTFRPEAETIIVTPQLAGGVN